MIDYVYIELDWDVVQTTAGFRYTIPILFFILITSTALSPAYITNEASAQSAEVPNWRTHTIWQYNVTLADTPGTHKATVKITLWGTYIDDNNTKFDTFIISQITNTAFSNDTYGSLLIRERETTHITRTDYNLAFTERNTTYYYEHTIDNVTEVRISNYNQMIDLFNFPLQVGEKWHQTVIANTTTQVKVKKPTIWEIVREDITYDPLSLYAECTGIEDVTVTITDNEEVILDDSLAANWTEEQVSAYRVVRDNEEQDTDGTYTVDYYNITKGNIVRKEIWEDGELNITWSLVYTNYIYAPDPFKPPERGDEDSPEVFVCIAGIVLLAILVIAFFIIRKRSIPKGERFTKEYIEAVDTKTELIELCEEAKLSTKGAKGQLRKRLLAYVAELERVSPEQKQGEEDFEDEVITEDKVDLEEDMDELTLDEDDTAEEDESSLSDDKEK